MAGSFICTRYPILAGVSLTPHDQALARKQMIIGGIQLLNMSWVQRFRLLERDMLSSGIRNPSTKCKLFGQILTPKKKNAGSPSCQL